MHGQSIFPMSELPLSPPAPTQREWTAQGCSEELEQLYRLYYKLGEEFLAVEEEQKYSLLDKSERDIIRRVYNTALERYAKKLDICRQNLDLYSELHIDI